MAHTKSRSGPTIGQEERAARGYRNRTFSLPDTTSELIDDIAARMGTTRSAVIVSAVRALSYYDRLQDLVRLP